MIKKLLFMIGLCISTNSYSQKVYTLKDFFTEKSVVWYGVDYSRCKFVGSLLDFPLAGLLHVGTGAEPDQLRDKYFHDWNNLFITEPEKYNIGYFLHKDEVIMDISSVEEINKEVQISCFQKMMAPCLPNQISQA